MFEKPSDMTSGQTVKAAGWHGHNDNIPFSERLAMNTPAACGRLSIEADGTVREFIVPTDEEIDLMVLISEIAATADRSELEAAARVRQQYLLLGSAGAMCLTFLALAVFWL